ncbi:hypothetical protein PR202_gb28819 [Eleusine coracana subsp. coracana]|uniref:KIB1-4 beta-propeller domain-containing protein n=1 Tax=Eleusine coracana subsp. coracana TaxID=191504 RepID=A0AAV5FVL2_ELECO|nr:hypothetical protein PR202_gb28819 [Eleusine coracana subsp. coracana]
MPPLPQLLLSSRRPTASPLALSSWIYGWAAAAPEQGKQDGHGSMSAGCREVEQALKPLTGAQVDLPPATGLHHVETCSDEQGRPAYIVHDEMLPHARDVHGLRALWRFIYQRVYLSCSPSMGAKCVVLLLHSHDGEMSFARVGDSLWTQISWKDPEDESFMWDFG